MIPNLLGVMSETTDTGPRPMTRRSKTQRTDEPHAGQAIKRRRKELGLSQEKLAALVGVEQQGVHGQEQRATLLVDTAQRYADALGVSVEWIRSGGKGDPEAKPGSAAKWEMLLACAAALGDNGTVKTILTGLHDMSQQQRIALLSLIEELEKQK